jgi:hypothetical protein
MGKEAKGLVKHIVDDSGEQTDQDHKIEYLCEW